jgi:hypothetical protein
VSVDNTFSLNPSADYQVSNVILNKHGWLIREIEKKISNFVPLNYIRGNGKM